MISENCENVLPPLEFSEKHNTIKSKHFRISKLKKLNRNARYAQHKTVLIFYL